MKNILIIRLSAIGDVVFSSPLIKSLRRSYPDAKISWLVEPPAAPLLRHNPELDQVIVWRKMAWKKLWQERKYLKLWREIRAFRQRLKSHQFDVVLDLQGLMKSTMWAVLSGAPQRIGLDPKENTDRWLTRIVRKPEDNSRIGSEYLAMAQALELDVQDFAMDIGLSAADDGYPAQTIEASQYAVICPFTTRPQKHWLESRWPELATQLQAQLNMPVVMLGGPGDIDAAGRIAENNDQIINLVGQSLLMQTAATIKHASLLIGVDTGLTHMGIAFNVPTVALFGSTCPYSDTTRDNAVVLYHKMDCSPCRRSPSCDGDFTCMKKIEIDEIMQTVERVCA